MKELHLISAILVVMDIFMKWVIPDQEDRTVLIREFIARFDQYLDQGRKFESDLFRNFGMRQIRTSSIRWNGGENESDYW